MARCHLLILYAGGVRSERAARLQRAAAGPRARGGATVPQQSALRRAPVSRAYQHPASRTFITSLIASDR